MIKKLLPTVFASTLLIACSSNEQVVGNEYNDLMKSYIYDSARSNGGFSSNDLFASEEARKGIKSITESYKVDVLSTGGVVFAKDNINYIPDSDDILKHCKVNLYKNDLEDVQPLRWRIFGFHTYIIKNKTKLADIDICVKKYLKVKTLANEDLLYVLSDDRIKNNLHYDFLKNSLADGLKDDKLTYFEAYDIYRNLDKALELNVLKKVDSMKKDVKEKTTLEK